MSDRGSFQSVSEDGSQKVYALEAEQKELLTNAFNLMDVTGAGEIERADLEQAVTHKRGSNFFGTMGKGQPHPIKLYEFLKIFQAVGMAKGEKTLISLNHHVEKGVPVWLRAHHQ